MAFSKNNAGTVQVTIEGQTILAESGTFGTGSRGYMSGGSKVLINGKRYQVTLNLVEIGSKPEAAPAAAPGPVVEQKPVKPGKKAA